MHRSHIMLIGSAGLLAVPFAVRAAPAESADAAELVCKKTAETGSLVRKREQCLTRAEWERLAAAEQDESRRMMDALEQPAGM